MNTGRFIRTLGSLHPLQVASRPVRWAQTALFRGMPTGAGPELCNVPADDRPALRALAVKEEDRMKERLGRLQPGSLLRRYEESYALDFERLGPGRRWSSRVALHPFPASVRARRLAVAIRLGRPGLERELIRACRAVALQPELHLLGNHLLENGIGLVCGAAVMRGLEADVWWKLGCALLDWQVPVQFCGDGGHIERSASYHAAVLSGFLEALALAADSSRRAPESWRDTSQHALRWLHTVRAPDDTYPLFNDASLDAAPRIADVFALAASLGLGQPDPSPLTPCRVLRETGWVVLEASDGAWLAFDAGPDGALHQPGHVHADALTFELWVDAQRAVVDYGVSDYSRGPARERTRATRYHSTVELGGIDSCEVWDAFRVGRRQRATILEASPVGSGGRAVACHDGYQHLPGAPVHRRELRLEAGRLAVEDHIEGRCSRPGVSRLRLDAAVARRLEVSGSGPIEYVDDEWHPKYAEARPAIVCTQKVQPGRPSRFTLNWTS